MGCWGMGITQSDEFCEVYDRFLEEYDKGNPVVKIREEILSEYTGNFDENDGILHDVYFAIAKAEWMCAEQSDIILDKVQYIVDNNLNIEFYRELGAMESDLRLRKRNLQKFLSTLQTPRKAPRKRIASVNEQVPSLTKGAVFWYRAKTDVYGAVVLDIIEKHYLIAISEKLSKEPKDVDLILSAPVFSLSWFTLLLPQKRMHVVGNLKITDDYNGRAGLYVDKKIGLVYCENCSTEEDWKHEMQLNPDLNNHIKDYLIVSNVPSDFEHRDILENNINAMRKINGIKD